MLNDSLKTYDETLFDSKKAFKLVDNVNVLITIIPTATELTTT